MNNNNKTSISINDKNKRKHKKPSTGIRNSTQAELRAMKRTAKSYATQLKAELSAIKLNTQETHHALKRSVRERAERARGERERERARAHALLVLRARSLRCASESTLRMRSSHCLSHSLAHIPLLCSSSSALLIPSIVWVIFLCMLNWFDQRQQQRRRQRSRQVQGEGKMLLCTERGRGERARESEGRIELLN